MNPKRDEHSSRHRRAPAPLHLALVHAASETAATTRPLTRSLALIARPRTDANLRAACNAGKATVVKWKEEKAATVAENIRAETKTAELDEPITIK